MKKMFLVFIILGGLCLVPACLAGPQTAAAPQPTPALSARATATPAPTLTPLAPTLTETSEPTVTEPPSPTPIPESWKTFSDPQLNISLRYPDGWSLERVSGVSARASGADGFLEISTRPYAPSMFDRVINLCVDEANGPTAGSLYGTDLFINDWQGWDVERQTWFGYGCALTPADMSKGQAVLFLRDARPEGRKRLLTLRGDANHFGGILASLRMIDFSTPEPSTGYYDSPACQKKPAGEAVSTWEENGLVITEKALAIADCDPWKHLDGFQARVTGAEVDRTALYEQDKQARAAEASRALAPFGYSVVYHASNSGGSYDLLKGADVVAGGFTQFGPVSVNAAGDDFILWVQDGYNGTPPREVRVGGARSGGDWFDGFNTAWAGSDLVSFVYSKTRVFPVGAPADVEISVNGTHAQDIAIPMMGPAGSPVRGLWSWQNHWMMEISGVLFDNGAPQNQILGYDEIFNWHLVNGKPFYLARQAAPMGYAVVYDGKALRERYDDIIHGDLCCDPARYTIADSPAGSVFYALRDGVWKLVIVRAKQ